ncbi:MAG: hypothetical protein LBG84_06105 [Treponema sp.]|jgi:hypothetical protein|nr:hypothetical protein [Treponema sp.]
MRRPPSSVPRVSVLLVLELAALFWTSRGYAQTQDSALNALVSPENAAVLRRGERITRVQTKQASPLLIPQDTQIKNLTSRLIRELGPSFFVEALTVYRKPAAGPPGGAWTAGERTGLYNQCLALSTLAGLLYYSASRKQMRVFYESSSVVTGPDGATPRPDPSYTSPPAELTIYARQKDLSFGDNVYRYDYYSGPGSLIFVQENITSMNYGPIQAVGPGRLRSLVAVYDAGEYLLIYIASMAKASAIPGMNDRISRSFINRADAILNWFSARADRVFKKT